MKESWMEKLRELLNEFDPYISKDWEHRDNLWYSVICWESAVFTKEIWVLKIISKEYLFIDWLVKNNKIKFREDFYLEDTYWWWFGEDELIVMLLSIQDEPIEFLVSILK